MIYAAATIAMGKLISITPVAAAAPAVAVTASFLPLLLQYPLQLLILDKVWVSSLYQLEIWLDILRWRLYFCLYFGIRCKLVYAGDGARRLPVGRFELLAPPSWAWPRPSHRSPPSHHHTNAGPQRPHLPDQLPRRP